MRKHKPHREKFSNHREEIINWINAHDSFDYKDLLAFCEKDCSTLDSLLILCKEQDYVQCHARGKYLLIKKIPIDIKKSKIIKNEKQQFIEHQK